MSVLRMLAGVAGVAAGVIFASGARGEILTVEFAGNMGLVFGSPYAGAAVGDTFTGSFSYDTSVPATSDNGEVAGYRNSLRSYSITIQTGGGPVTLEADTVTGTFGGLGNPAAGLTVKNDEPSVFTPGEIIDAFNVIAGNSATHLSMGISLTGNAMLPATGPLTSRDLPTSLDLAGFNVSTNQQVQLALSFSSVANGTITSLRVIPAPGAVACMLLTGGVAVSRRRR